MKKGIESDRSIELLARFLCLLSYSQGMFEYPETPRFPSKPGPTLKDLLIHDDYANYLWFDGKWLAKLIYDISMRTLNVISVVEHSH